MKTIKRVAMIVGLAAVLATSSADLASVKTTGSGFNDEYVFATTRSLNDMEGVNPGLKLPLFPVTIVLDTIFLPFAVIAGFVA